MVFKAKSDSPIKPLQPGVRFTNWPLPALDSGVAPHFRQPQEETEDERPEVELVDKISEAELEQIKQEAFAQGLKEGQAQGLAESREMIQQKTVALEMLLEQLSEPLSQCGEQTQQQVLKLAFAVARQIIRREIQQDPTQLIAIIREALRLLPIGAQKIRVQLHPEDAAIIRQALNIDPDSASGRWRIQDDPSVERGSCRLQTENSKVDASIDKQVAVLFSKVAGGLRAGENHAD